MANDQGSEDQVSDDQGSDVQGALAADQSEMQERYALLALLMRHDRSRSLVLHHDTCLAGGISSERNRPGRVAVYHQEDLG